MDMWSSMHGHMVLSKVQTTRTCDQWSSVWPHDSFQDHLDMSSGHYSCRINKYIITYIVVAVINNK